MTPVYLWLLCASDTAVMAENSNTGAGKQEGAEEGQQSETNKAHNEDDLTAVVKLIVNCASGVSGRTSERACLCHVLSHEGLILARSSSLCNTKDTNDPGVVEISALRHNDITKVLNTQCHEISTVHVLASSVHCTVGVLSALASFASHYPGLTLTLTFATLTNLNNKEVRTQMWNLYNARNVKIRVISKSLLQCLLDNQQVTYESLNQQGPPCNVYDYLKLREVIEEQGHIRQVQGQLVHHSQLMSECIHHNQETVSRVKYCVTKITTALSKSLKDEKTSSSSSHVLSNSLSLVRNLKKDWRHVLTFPKLHDSRRHLGLLINDISEAVSETETLQVIKQALNDAQHQMLWDVPSHVFDSSATYTSCFERLKSGYDQSNDLRSRQGTLCDDLTRLADDLQVLSRDSYQADSDTWCLNGVGVKVLTDLVLRAKSIINDVICQHYLMQAIILNLHLVTSELQLANKKQTLCLHKQAAELISESKVKRQLKVPVRTLEVIVKQCTGSMQGQGHLLPTEEEHDGSSNRCESQSSLASRPLTPTGHEIAHKISDDQQDKEADEDLDAYSDEQVLKLTMLQYQKQAL